VGCTLQLFDVAAADQNNVLAITTVTSRWRHLPCERHWLQKRFLKTKSLRTSSAGGAVD